MFVMQLTAFKRNSSLSSILRFSTASQSFWMNLPSKGFCCWNSVEAAFSSVDKFASSFKILVSASSRLPVENSS
jgi:hypothetical protein